MTTMFQLLLTALLAGTGADAPCDHSQHVAQADEGTGAAHDAHDHHDPDYMSRTLGDGEYDPADVVAQPGAQVGELTACPVSGEVFVVDADHPYVEYEGDNVYFCCPGCIRRFQRDPEAWLAQ